MNPANYTELMEELEILRALDLNRRRRETLERLLRCNGEPVSDTAGSPVHPAPTPG